VKVNVNIYLDKNECEEWGFCDQLCSNSFGGHECSCVDGYTKNAENICVADTSLPKMQIYFAHNQQIVVLDKDGKLARELGNATSASGLDYHLKRNKLFYTDVDAKKVFQVLVSLKLKY